MNHIRNNFLNALAATTRLDFREMFEADPLPLNPAWIVLVHALLGLAYALIAILLNWLLSAHFLAALASTIAISFLHTNLTSGKELSLPNTLRKALFPAFGAPENPAADLLTSLLLPLLLLCLLFQGGAIWLPAILALGATLGAELAHPDSQSFSLKEGASWLTAAIATLLCVVFPFLGNRQLLQHQFLLAALLFGIIVLLLPWMKHLPNRPASFAANSLLARFVILILILLFLAF